jgi:hypothetical protein
VIYTANCKLQLLEIYIKQYFKYNVSFKSHDRSVGIAQGCGLDDWGSRVRFPAGAGIFLFTTASKMALGLANPPIQWVQGALSLGVKQSGSEADHSPPASAKVKE